ncbi:MAG TPA: FecR domain-containing protein [Polyangiaceae bacterium LLY-WYZ-15_(1-7)]|nr:hypothetical protein [Sandaracinus sp.]HJL05162.1 FecR domain-containing protein [Polyangiaceae bacterium LLY-WYZ-15_(1-7)]MBJ71810.1 hypothetical protein [Sandaracinus sp.]HJL13013.1 FecR domain-containing protein [Polyangiaceae bacterium LLY-WYZ-15_(1-7)]HJL22853.1 FecR domain-containing protein [Polyangiaceae bacterium LLY-WYZ-15_(1-7)]
MADHRDLARELREEPPRPDDLARARMERALLERRPAASAPPPRARGRGRAFAAGVGVGLVAAAAVLLGWWTLRPAPRPEEAPIATAPARFEALRDGVAVREGALEEGEPVQTAAGQMLRVRFGGDGGETSLVEVAPRSRAIFERTRGDHQRVRLTRGQVRVEFHPERRGAQSFVVETPLATVEVVGTVFEVRVEEGVSTRVRVREGVVRVRPREGAPRMVRAGEQTTVLRADERAARETEAPAEVAPETEPEAQGAAAESAAWGGTPAWERGETSAADEERWVTVLPGPWEGTGEAAEAEGVEADTSEDAAEAGASEDAEETESAPPLSDDARFDLAMRLLDRGEFGRARHELLAIARTTRSRRTRARAWSDIAMVFRREGDARQAAEAYRRASRAGRGTAEGANALFALGQMRSALGETSAARAAFERYLEASPEGPLAGRARRSLCRLGDEAACRR